jgi:uncharacterized oligopeptide transporter (OPT) family protein
MPAEAVDRVIGEEEAAAARRPIAIDEDDSRNVLWIVVGVAAASFFGFLLIAFRAVVAALGSASPAGFFAILVLGLGLEVFLASHYARRRAVSDRTLLVTIALTPVAVAALLTGACFGVFG